MRVGGLFAVVGAVLLTAPTQRQRSLESIQRLECVFTAGVSADWSGAEPSVRTLGAANRLTLNLSDINVVDGSATLRDGARTSSVSARSDRSNLYFFDLGSSGTATLTTVFSQETRPGHLKAAHTRTGVDAAQFYGDCEIGR